ncbi:MAG: MBL fold metallo-hydrolase [Gemmatimonadetes bacterium]|nr:MBL fold metallo-hydrolase [Gemmatimonadota bacterium]
MSTVLTTGGFMPAAEGCRRAVVPSPWPPRSVAVFLIESGGSWLVDTGAATLESVESLGAALDEELGPGGMPDGVILTHSHLDHAGGLEALGSEVVVAHRETADLYEADERTPHGQPFATVEGDAGSLPDLPGWEWVLGEGHAPGHLMPWHSASGTLLSIDQFLLGLKTPLRIADPAEDSFGSYMATLDRVASLEPAVMLSSHTASIAEPAAWLDRERRRLNRQLDRARLAVQDGARTAEEVTDTTYGSIPGPSARQLLLREKLAALRHLASLGEIRRIWTDGQEGFEV